MWRSSTSVLSRPSTRQPSMSGSRISSVIASGLRSRASVRPEAPNAVTRVRKPCSRPMSRMICENATSFSTISIGRDGHIAAVAWHEALRQVQGEGTSLIDLTRQHEFSAKQARQLTTNRQAQARPTVLPARAAIGLLERFEDDLLFLEWDTDAGVGHRNRDDRACLIERLVVAAPAARRRYDPQRHSPSLCKLERV